MTDHRSYEQLSELEQLQSEYWDFYKSVHNIRPRYVVGTTTWNSVELLTEAIKSLSSEAEVVWAAEAKQEQENIASFEALVAKMMSEMMSEMNKDRETIVRWMFDASICNGDWEFYCYELGIPYGYFKEFEK